MLPRNILTNHKLFIMKRIISAAVAFVAVAALTTTLYAQNQEKCCSKKAKCQTEACEKKSDCKKECTKKSDCKKECTKKSDCKKK